MDPNGDGRLDMKELDRIMLATPARTERMKKHSALFQRGRDDSHLTPLQRMASARRELGLPGQGDPS